MIGRSTEIKHLQALVALAQELHFGREAQRLNMTQPALSQSIRDMEARLGFRLLERTTRKVLLTGPGRTFLAEAELILRHLDRAVDTARTEAGQASNTLRVGAILPTAFEFLPRTLSRFRHRYPDAHVHIENKESQHLAAAVESGALHVAILRPPRNAGTLRIETLRRDHFVAAMRVDHPLAKSEALHLRDLKAEKVVRIVRGDLREAFDAIDRELEAAGVDLSRSQSAETTLTALALVCAGDGISLVPSWAAGLPWTEVCFRQVHDLTASIELAAVWESTNFPPIAQHFVEMARRAAAEQLMNSRRGGREYQASSASVERVSGA